MRRIPLQPPARRGFTLTEVLVAVPLLVLVFWITGNIFTTTRDTVDLGMVHSKVTASAESAVQRVARDSAGMRPDGRLVVMAGRMSKRPLAKEDPLNLLFPGTWGQIAFIGQGTYVSQYPPYSRSNLARVWYYPAKRLPGRFDYWNSDVVLRDVMLFTYAEAAAANPADEAQPLNSVPGLIAPDVLAWKRTQVTVGGAPQFLQRQDLMKRAKETFRIPDAGNVRNHNGNFPLAGGTPDFQVQMPPAAGGAASWFQFWNPNDRVDPVTGNPFPDYNPNGMLKLLLSRTALIDNGVYAPPDGWTGGVYNVTDITTGANVAKSYFPPGVPPVDPNPNAAAKDPGGASMFQVWTRDQPGGVDNWLPRASDVPAAGGGAYWMRKYMFIKDTDDQNEYDADAARNRASNSAQPVPWPTAVRFNFHIFDKVGRFKHGALFQAVVEVPASRIQ